MASELTLVQINTQLLALGELGTLTPQEEMLKARLLTARAELEAQERAD